MKYQANPVIVDAFTIVSVGLLHGDSCPLVLDNGEHVIASSAMLARYTPVPGDYWVIQEDGYIYVNPKEVFERKCHPLNESSKAAS